MSVLVRLPGRERVQAVMLERYGAGWRVGTGPLVAGTIDRDASCYISEREAEAAALALADAHDLIAVRSDL